MLRVSAENTENWLARENVVTCERRQIGLFGPFGSLYQYALYKLTESCTAIVLSLQTKLN